MRLMMQPCSVLSLIIAYLTSTDNYCNHLALLVLVKAHTQKSQDIKEIRVNDPRKEFSRFPTAVNPSSSPSLTF